jgi:hypothetical protein
MKSLKKSSKTELNEGGEQQKTIINIWGEEITKTTREEQGNIARHSAGTYRHETAHKSENTDSLVHYPTVKKNNKEGEKKTERHRGDDRRSGTGHKWSVRGRRHECLCELHAGYREHLVPGKDRDAIKKNEQGQEQATLI